MPNKNKTACKRRIRSQRSQRRRYRTARNGGWSPLRPFRKASETRRTNNVPPKWWQSPRRWNDEREKRNLANEIAIQRAAAEAATHNVANTRAAIDARLHQMREDNKINLKINALTDHITLATHDQRKTPRYISMVARRKELMEQLKTNRNATRGAAVYSTVPAAAYSQQMPL